MPNSQVDITTVPQTTNDYTDLKGLLAQLIRTLGAKTLLEIGTDVGDSTRLFSALLHEQQGQVWTVDRVPPKGDWMTTWPLKNITFLQGDSKLLRWGQKVDVLFLDGDQTYEGALHDLAHLGPWVRAGGKLVCHGTLRQQTGDTLRKALHEWTTLHRLPWTHYPYQAGLAIVDICYDVPPPVPLLPAPTGAQK